MKSTTVVNVGLGSQIQQTYHFVQEVLKVTLFADLVVFPQERVGIF